MVQLKTEIWQVENGQFSLETKFRAAERGDVPVHTLHDEVSSITPIF